jgi:methylase of polypeptide subunit release factors
VLLLEFGAGQEKQVSHLLSRTKAYSEIRIVNDSSGTPRVAVAVKSEPAAKSVR